LDITFKNKISVNDYIKLRRTADWKDISKRQVRAGLRNSVYLLSARHNKMTIGMARVIGDGGYVLLIVDVVVLPEYRGKGVGTMIMENVMARIHDSVRDGEGVMVQLMSAKGRESFYRRFGFVSRPNESLGPGMTQWIEDIR